MQDCFFQPLVQTKKYIVFNLILAAICSTAILLLLPLLFSMGSDFGSYLGFSFIVLAVTIIFYLIVIFPFLLIYFCTLQHFNKFNIFSILIACFMGTILLALFSGNTDHFLKVLMNLSVFSIPTAAFFLFFSLRRHRVNTENLPI